MNGNRWAMLGIAAAGISAILAALNGFNHEAPWFVLTSDVFLRIVRDPKFHILFLAPMFGGAAGAVYPWFLDPERKKALGETIIRRTSALVTLAVGLLVTLYTGRVVEGIMLSVAAAIIGTVFAFTAINWVVHRFKIIPGALVPTNAEVRQDAVTKAELTPVSLAPSAPSIGAGPHE